MAMKIVILEDNEDRRVAMRRCLEDRFYQFEAKFFGDAAEMIDYLEKNLAETLLICLDHDLELVEKETGELTDPGTGREIAEFLAGKPPACPIIIHTSNSVAAAGMEMVLRDANWETFRVLPVDDCHWIPGPWFQTLRRAILQTAKRREG